MATTIHPTAIIDPGARIGENVEIGPNVVVETDVAIGDRCRLMPGAVLHRYTEMGSENVVGPYCVLGGLPQDLGFDAGTPTFLRIGSGNVFREYVTLNRATDEGGATTLGDGCYLMTQCHVGHDSALGSRVIMANNAAIAGHCEIHDGANISANVVIHQFCWVGRMVMMRGNSATSCHIPPFVMTRDVNFAVGLNVVGMRRAGFDAEQRDQVKAAYRLLYRSGLTPAAALAEMDSHSEWGEPAATFRDFVRRAIAAEKPYDRGLITGRVGKRGR